MFTTTTSRMINATLDERPSGSLSRSATITIDRVAVLDAGMNQPSACRDAEESTLNETPPSPPRTLHRKQSSYDLRYVFHHGLPPSQGRFHGEGLTVQGGNRNQGIAMH
jgi:hypothetical protein